MLEIKNNSKEMKDDSDGLIPDWTQLKKASLNLKIQKQKWPNWKAKIKKKTEKNRTEYKRCSTCVVGIQEGEEEKVIKEISEVRMAEVISN